MPDISKIQVNGETLDIKDEVARSGGGVIGVIENSGNGITVKGDSFFAVFLSAQGMDNGDIFLCAGDIYDIACVPVGDTSITGPNPSDEGTIFYVSEYAYYIIFGADSIETTD